MAAAAFPGGFFCLFAVVAGAEAASPASRQTLAKREYRGILAGADVKDLAFAFVVARYAGSNA